MKQLFFSGAKQHVTNSYRPHHLEFFPRYVYSVIRNVRQKIAQKYRLLVVNTIAQREILKRQPEFYKMNSCWLKLAALDFIQRKSEIIIHVNESILIKPVMDQSPEGSNQCLMIRPSHQWLRTLNV